MIAGDGRARSHILAAAIAVLAVLTGGCASRGYYRLPRTPGADGSVSNDVVLAYFALGKPPLGARHAYTEFDPDTDEEVVFVLRIHYPRRAFALRGVLYRPGGVEHTSFSRTGQPYQPGSFSEYTTHEAFPMSSLRPFIGTWALKVFGDDVPLGTYEFVVADKTRIKDFRPSR